jgi:hypothetical protein
MQHSCTLLPGHGVRVHGILLLLRVLDQGPGSCRYGGAGSQQQQKLLQPARQPPEWRDSQCFPLVTQTLPDMGWCATKCLYRWCLLWAGHFEEIHFYPGSRGEAEINMIEGSWASSRCCLPWVDHYEELHFITGSHDEMGWVRIKRWPARSQWRLPWVGHLRNSIFHLVPMGRRGGSGLRGVGQEAGGTSLWWAISRNSICLPGSHWETRRIRIEGRRARSQWRLPWVVHFKEFNFSPGSHGEPWRIRI